MLHVLSFHNKPIYEQLLLEEALLRLDDRNWCIFNEGSPRAIIMGISGKVEELVDLKRATRDQISILQRYSGGGTVIVDQDTLFVSLICRKDFVPCKLYPEPLLRFSAKLYQQSLQIPGFGLIENDYVIREKKCGGNAQYLKKDRFVHHTTFLWDYTEENMSYLLYPKKTPRYRNARSHGEFLCKLSPYFSSKSSFFSKIKTGLKTLGSVQEVDAQMVQDLLSKPYRISTRCIIK